MLSKKEIIDHTLKLSSEWSYDADKDVISCNSNDGKIELSGDSYVKKYREIVGTSFDCIYSEHVSLFSLLQCTKCGTVIFEYEDEDWEPNLHCPTCTDKKTGFTFLTKAEIEADPEKQKMLRLYTDMQKHQIEADERWFKRGRLYDWQIKKWRKVIGHTLITFELECADITKSYFKGLRLIIGHGKGDTECGYKMGSSVRIPLSTQAFYTQFIYHHLGKCEPTLRSKWFIGKPKESMHKEN